MIRILSDKTKVIYSISINKSGENNQICPECSHLRKTENQKTKVFSWNNEKLVGFCNHCQTSFYLYKPYKDEKQYQYPEWKNNTQLTDKAVKYFEGRMISQKTLIKMKVYSDNEFMPQLNSKSEVICFPYFLDEKLINIKFRGAKKSFKLFKDAELIFYNINCVKDFKEIIITEGEIDTLSFIEIGINNVISVPNGAGVKVLSYIDNYIELFENKTIIIASDNDIKGFELRNELLRRFGNENCKIINFKDTKDANEYLIKYGGLELKNCYQNAVDVPVEGIINLNSKYDDIYNLYINGLQKGLTIDEIELDKLISFETGRLLTITGIPGHGKSEVLDYILTKLNILHQWKVAYFSPENYPIEIHYSKLASKITGKKFNTYDLKRDEFDFTFNYILDNFFFIYPEENINLNNILDKAKYLIKKFGIKVLVIDPYNKLEHQKGNGESETEYISKFLDKLSMFAKKNNILICLVAHPRKMEKDKKKFEIPTLYDINGSANFYNKTDYGITIYRHFNEGENRVDVLIQKVKFKHLGTIGAVSFAYNYYNGRMEKIDSMTETWEKNNYLYKIPESELINLPNNLEFEQAPF